MASNARSNLNNAFAILDAGIISAVDALVVARAAADDDSYVEGLTSRVLSIADTLALAVGGTTPLAPTVPTDAVEALNASILAALANTPK